MSHSHSSSARPPLHLALLLHMHQPFYVEPDASGSMDNLAAQRALLPWVRLHGASGYLDVATSLLHHPGAHVTVNLVPSLLLQLDAVAAGQRDRYLDLAERSMNDLDLEDRVFLLTRFFSINWSRAVDPRPRYRHLLDKRGRDVTQQEIRRRAPLFSPEELRDLTVLFHLSWLGFAIREWDREGDQALLRLEEQGGGYTLDQLRLVVDRGRAACARVLPLYRELSDRGQVELGCSPCYHPIVPLLCDSDVARESQPDAQLPTRFAHLLDGAQQVRRGREVFSRILARKAGGMWPAEGSISPAALHCYAQEGTPWLVSDEGNLWRSLPPPQDDAHSRGLSLCRAHSYEGVALFFRDRDLSDRIGFRYAHDDPEGAVTDLLQGAANTASHGLPHPGANPHPVVTIALDGENPWESYPERGRLFLSALFSRLAARPTVGDHVIIPVTFSEHLAQVPPPAPLPRLWAGSWIDSDFHIWIGDPIKNRAWELLGRARSEFEKVAATAPDPGAANLSRAYEFLLVAEGSDWFWWFGEPFHSGEDALYDRLFRDYLAAAYRAMGRPVPADLLDPVDDSAGGDPQGGLSHAPRAFIRPKIDGKRTHYYEWAAAGVYKVPSGAAMADRPDLQAIYFGFDRDTLYVRVDPVERALLQQTALALDLGPLRVLVEPERPGQWHLLESGGPGKDYRLLRTGSPAAILDSLEVAIPWEALGVHAHVRPGQQLQLVVRLIQVGPSGRPWARYPRDGAITVSVPDDKFAAEHWLS